MKDRKINVLQVVNSLDIGGLEKVAINLVNDQSVPRNIDFSVLCLEEKGALHRCLSPAIKVFELRKCSRSYLSLILDFLKIVRKGKFDIVHCHNYAPLLFSIIVKMTLLGKVQIIYTEHNQVYRISRKHYWIFKQLLKHVDSIVTVSEDLKSHFSNNRLGKSSTVIWNGIPAPVYDDQLVRQIENEFKSNETDFIVGTAVVMSRQKGLKYLVDAAKVVVSKHPPIKFLLVGDGPLKEDLQEQVREQGLENHFFFPGYKKAIPNYIKAMDVFIMPSLWEGFSIALLEATALGVPIITTDVGGNGEIVENGTNGLLVAPKSPEKLAAAISQLYQDEELRQKFAREGKQLFARHFDVSRMVAKYDQEYKKLLEIDQ